MNVSRPARTSATSTILLPHGDSRGLVSGLGCRAGVVRAPSGPTPSGRGVVGVRGIASVAEHAPYEQPGVELAAPSEWNNAAGSRCEGPYRRPFLFFFFSCTTVQYGT